MEHCLGPSAECFPSGSIGEAAAVAVVSAIPKPPPQKSSWQKNPHAVSAEFGGAAWLPVWLPICSQACQSVLPGRRLQAVVLKEHHAQRGEGESCGSSPIPQPSGAGGSMDCILPTSCCAIHKHCYKSCRLAAAPPPIFWPPHRLREQGQRL